MPLPILGALVVFGIGGVVLLVHLLKMSAPAAFAGPEEARAAFLRDHPDIAIDDTLIADDGRVALFATAEGPGVAARFGSGAFTRLCRPGEVKRLSDRGAALRLELSDFAAPRIDFAAASPDLRAAARALLEPDPKETA